MKQTWINIGCLLVCTCSVLGKENVIRNGDFEKGKFKWKTDSRMRSVEEAGLETQAINKVLEVEIHKNKQKTVSQAISLRSNVRELDISFRIKSSNDYTNLNVLEDDFFMRCQQETSNLIQYTTRGGKLEKKGKWEDVEWSLKPFNGTKPLIFSITFNPGHGKIWLDDVVVKALKQ